MVNLEKQQNNRKKISLIKPQNSKASVFSSNITDNIKCEPLLYYSQPRTEHPVYTRQQYDDLNRQRCTYKNPEKFDVFPRPDSRDPDFPAVPPCQQPPILNKHTAKKQFIDTNSPIGTNNNHINSNTTDPNRSTHTNLLIVLAVLGGVITFLFLLINAPAFALFLLVLFLNFIKIKYE